MNHLGLFEGIGGFSLAARWAGWETLAWCEWNEFGQKVLRHHFPEAEGFGDITKTDFTKYANRIDVLTGGFPCQPFSLAGKRKGTEDERHLWPEMLRAIREIQPTWVVGENVFGIVNWDGGMVFNQVQADLEAEGYEVQPYVLPACAVNAPHRRDRVWFVAYNEHNRNRRRQQQQESEQEKSRVIENTWSDGCANGEYDKQRDFGNIGESCTRGEKRNFIGEALQDASNPNSNSEYEINTSEGGEYAQRNIEQMGRDVRNTNCTGLQGRCNTEQGQRFNGGHDSNKSFTAYSNSRRQPSEEHGKAESGRFTETSLPGDWQDFPTQPPICGGNDGLPTELDGITFPKWRNESIKAYGNAIVPQVAYQIFKAINEHTKHTENI
jgi:DNA (cytosine-5)-methyltransferase 1